MSWTEEEDKAAKQNQPTVNAESDSKQNSIDANNEIWALLEKTLLENMVEKRRARRWKIFFRFTTLAILVGILVAWFTRSELSEMQIQGDTVAIIPMQGVIGSDADIESSEMVSLLDSAYSNNQKGYKILLARDGTKAIQRLEQNPGTSIVLMDLMMPEMDGYKAIERIRNNHNFKNVPIIILTAKHMKGEKEKSMAAGANDFMTKPIDIDELLQKMNTLLCSN